MRTERDKAAREAGQLSALPRVEMAGYSEYSTASLSGVSFFLSSRLRLFFTREFDKREGCTVYNSEAQKLEETCGPTIGRYVTCQLASRKLPFVRFLLLQSADKFLNYRQI